MLKGLFEERPISEQLKDPVYLPSFIFIVYCLFIFVFSMRESVFLRKSSMIYINKWVMNLFSIKIFSIIPIVSFYIIYGFSVYSFQVIIRKSLKKLLQSNFDVILNISSIFTAFPLVSFLLLILIGPGKYDDSKLPSSLCKVSRKYYMYVLLKHIY